MDDVTYWHRSHPGPRCPLCRVTANGFRVLRIENGYVVIDMPDEPFKHPGYGLTTREALRLRRVIEQSAAADEGG
jgi:hypothetical protein